MSQQQQRIKRSHPEIIASELAKGVTPRTLAEISVPQTKPTDARKTKQLEDRIFQLANQVAIEVRLKYTYSSFHTHESLRQIKTSDDAMRKVLTVAADMAPFGNCLFQAHACVQGLRNAIKAEGNPDMLPYVHRVELATDNLAQKATGHSNYHCIAVVRLWDHCIVMDPIAFGYAVRVPLGQISRSEPSSSFRFCYVAVGSARLLVEYDSKDAYRKIPHPQSEGLFKYNDPFVSIHGGLAGGVVNLAWPSDSRYQGLPTRRCLWLQQAWNRKPSTAGMFHFALRDGSNKYMVDTGMLVVEYEHRELCMSNIPYGDWLTRPENAKFLRSIRQRNGFALFDNNTAEWTLKLDSSEGKFDRRVLERLEFMDELCTALGLQKGLVRDIANAMLERWQEPKQPAKQGLKRKRSGDDSDEDE
jgi:hypothetical protein